MFLSLVPYFDHNATTPLSPVAREAWLRINDEAWHNPASPYRRAARAKLKLDAARDTLARMIEGDAERVVFTSGATEAANAIFDHLALTLPADARLAVNPTEHPCVLAAAGRRFAGRIDWLPVDSSGVASPRSGPLSGEARVAAVVVMAANNETGVIQPWQEWAERCAAAGVAYVCDASQWLGKLPAGGLGASGWTFGAGHKFGAPKGTGFLHLPKGAEGFRSLVGGEQQRGRRAGTEDVAGASALVAALADLEQRRVMFESAHEPFRNQFEQVVVAALPGTVIVGAGAERLWNTSMLIPPGTAENTRWVARLDARSVQVSTGSACATGKSGPSHVLAALGVAPLASRRALRISAGWETTAADWDALTAAFIAAAKELNGTASAVVDA